MIDAFTLITGVGFLLQEGGYSYYMSLEADDDTGDEVDFGVFVGFCVVMMLFYIIAIATSYSCYKEFKAMYQE